jgi:hypothetical protein
MNFIIVIGLLIMGIGITAIVIQLLILVYKKFFNPESLLSPIQRVFSETQLFFVREIERMHSDNESKMLYVGDKEIYEKVTGESTNGESDYNRFLGIEGWDNADSKSDLYKSGNYVSELMLDLNRRFVYEKLKFDAKSDDEVLKNFSLNIKDNEELLYKVSNIVQLYEEKERIKSITYSGFSTNFRSGSLRYKMGNLIPIPHRETHWASFDGCKLFMLRNKMIFVGSFKKKNKVIMYDDILTGELFSNGIILSLANSKKILIDFPEYQDAVVKRDDRNIFTRVLQRVLENTVDQNLF